MRWKTLVVGLMCILTLVSGCGRQYFMPKEAFENCQSMGLPAYLDKKPVSIDPEKIDHTRAPATLLDPNRETRFLTLQEAIAMALENGNIGRGPGSGVINDDLNFQWGGFTPIDNTNIRVLTLEPAILYTNIESRLAQFDAVWQTQLNYTTTDQPVSTPLQSAQAQGTTNIANQDATVTTSLIKPLPTGGFAGITFSTPYELTNLISNAPKPSYSPSLTFGFEQPLLQSFGVQANQLNARPSSFLFPQLQNYPRDFIGALPGGGGILISRLRYDEQRTVLEEQVSQTLWNVEIAYWNLYAAYGRLHAREQPMRLAQEIWQEEEAKRRIGRQPGQFEAQARGQYQQFREQRLAALGEVLEAERQLRGLIGLPVEDGTRLIPTDKPVLTPYQPDWDTAEEDCMKLRPALIIARQELKSLQLRVMQLKNKLLPDLRVTGSYGIQGIGDRLDGPDSDNAFRSLASNHFNNWSLGLILNVPMGYRAEQAQLRQAQLRMDQAYWVLGDYEKRARSSLALEYRRIVELQKRRQILQAEREAYSEQFLLLNALRRTKTTASEQPQLLEALRFWSQSRADEVSLIAQYNSALAGFEYKKGTLPQHDNVTIADGPLPGHAQVRAVEHERERTKAIVVRELAKPVAHPPCDPDKATPGLPVLPANDAPSVPALLEGVKQAEASAEQAAAAQQPETAPAQPDVPGAATLAPAPINGHLVPPPSMRPLH